MTAQSHSFLFNSLMFPNYSEGNISKSDSIGHMKKQGLRKVKMNRSSLSINADISLVFEKVSVTK